MYGDPVYHARSLIRIDSTLNYFNDDSNCEYLVPRSSRDFTSNSGILSPNPATDFVEIKSNQQIINVEVFSISGKEILLDMDLSTQIVYINTNQLPNGIYIIKALNNLNKLELYKLVVIH